jgi:hypothetical protein
MFVTALYKVYVIWTFCCTGKIVFMKVYLPETDVLTEPPLIGPGHNNVIWTHTAAIGPMAVPGGGQRLDVHDNLSMKICNKSKDA